MLTYWIYFILVLVVLWILLILCQVIGWFAPEEYEPEEEKSKAFNEWDKKRRWKYYEQRDRDIEQ